VTPASHDAGVSSVGHEPRDTQLPIRLGRRKRGFNAIKGVAMAVPSGVVGIMNEAMAPIRQMEANERENALLHKELESVKAQQPVIDF
jgi:hypothetical protein